MIDLVTLAKFGYGQGVLHNILKVWNEYIGDEWEIVKIDSQEHLVISQQIYNFLLENKCGLTKSLLKYSNKCSTYYCYNGNYITTKEIIKEKIEANKKRQEELRIKKEKEAAALKKKLENFKEIEEKYGDRWKTYEWVKENIGEYYNYEKEIEYMWTLIGNDWQKANWKGDIIISVTAKDRVINGGLKNFLNRKFKVNGYSHSIVEYYDCDNNGATVEKVSDNNTKYVYGIFNGLNLIYIGKTYNIVERTKQHHDRLNNPQNYDNWQQDGLYKEMRENEGQCHIRILYQGEVSELGIEEIERQAIELFQPKYNKKGKTMEYDYEKNALERLSSDSLLAEIKRRMK